jgi:lysophospholipase
VGGDAAPLISTAAAPVPEGAAAEWVRGDGGARLRAALFAATAPSSGSVILSPGRSEPIEKYFEAVGRLTGAGFTVLAHDWRGQGLSRSARDGPRGDARGWRPFVADFQRLLAAFADRLPKPWLAIGHSMGGCLTLLAMAEGETRFAATLLSAPMLGLNTGDIPEPAARLAARISTLFGRGSQPATKASAAPDAFSRNILTHDANRYARNLAQIVEAPQLAVGAPTWGWLDFAFAATRRLAVGAGAAMIATPLTAVLAGDEKLVDNVAARRTLARVQGARVVEAPGAYHELMQETDTVQTLFWAEFDALVDRLRGG